MIQQIERFSHNIQVTSCKGNHLQNAGIDTHVDGCGQGVSRIAERPELKGQDVLLITVQSRDRVSMKATKDAHDLRNSSPLRAFIKGLGTELPKKIVTKNASVIGVR